MNPGCAQWGDMPRLNLLLTLGGETLTGEARAGSAPGGPASARPHVGYARAWLRACGRAQRLMEANGSCELFGDEPLRVDIESPVQGGPWTEAAFNALGAATSAAFHGARWLARAAAKAGREGVPGMEAAQAAATRLANALDARMPSPTMDTVPVEREGSPLVSRAPIARLPSLGRVLHRVDGLGRAAPSWSEQALADYIAVHEFGHCAQAIHSKAPGDYYGWGSMVEDERALFANLGALEAPGSLGPLGQALRFQFGECYADTFAALALGAGDGLASSAQASAIGAMRAASFSSELARYSEGDSEHDTREALAELRARLASGPTPAGGAEVHAMCMACAQLGCLRWAAAVATQDAGPLSQLFWRQAASVAEEDGHQAYFEEEFERLVAQAKLSPLLAPIADSLSQAAPRARAGHGAGIQILLSLEARAGTPRETLRGAQPPSSRDRPQADGLRGKLASQRSQMSPVAQAVARAKPQA